ncbi:MULTISPECIES: hypothetical protein [Streptomyces]|uniref:hypothetical protein n=1 Tax=Streptomyces TaxID=1883 RepID=UPI000A37A89D|nr:MULTISPECIES: hypothetical protein [Streptomyces]AJZ86643.2 hypothetical protein AS97_08775 [Streptomyces sp. AgN23]RSS48595.1 hypothetical protein EF902_04835 [Streptomyces sp. WAC05858]WTA84442.1 hypothetical protein OG751_33740 [Streptomyces antimycoticus]WTB05112.1 hypothetical protein OG546_13350 [Streptomyces antimycoticus]
MERSASLPSSPSLPTPGPAGPAPSAESSALSRAERFVWLTARVLEQRRFAYHFLGGGAEAVETALAAYLGTDGGYGHALEPDLRGPASQPLHAVHALRVLDGIGRCGGQRVERLCRYLTSVSTPDGALPACHPSLRGYPAAPWVPAADDARGDLLTTGPVVGLLHRNEVWHAWLFRATDFCWAAVTALGEGGATTRPYEVAAAVAFLDGAPDRARAEAAAERLGRRVREERLIVPPTAPERAEDRPLPPGQGPGDEPQVHDIARTPGSLARRWFTEGEVERSLDVLVAAQQEDGGWPPPRRPWTPGATLEWRSVATVEALLTLRAYGRRI